MNEKINDKGLNGESFLYKSTKLTTTSKGTLLNQFWNVKDKDIVTEELFTNKLENDETKINFDEKSTKIESNEIKSNLKGNNDNTKQKSKKDIKANNEVVIMDNDKILEKYLDTIESERKDSELRIATNISELKKELREDRKNFEESLSKQMTDMHESFQKDMSIMNERFQKDMSVMNERFQYNMERLQIDNSDTRNTMKEMNVKLDKMSDKMIETSSATIRWVIALVVGAMISMLGMTTTFILKIWNP